MDGALAGQPQRARWSTWREYGRMKPCGLAGGRSPSAPDWVYETQASETRGFERWADKKRKKGERKGRFDIEEEAATRAGVLSALKEARLSREREPGLGELQAAGELPEPLIDIEIAGNTG